MKKILYSLIIGLSLLSTRAQAGIEFGVKAGTSISKINVKNLTSNFKSNNMVGWFIGPKVNASFLGFGGDAALLFTQRRYNVAENYTTTANSFEIPINARYTLGLSNLVAVFVSTGPQFGFNLNKLKSKDIKGKLDDILVNSFSRNNMSVSWNFGVGTKIAKHLEIELNYNLGITNDGKLKNITEILGIKHPTYRYRANTFNISAAYLF